MLKRELYLKKLRASYHTDLVKVITGVRRCGKSVLLQQIMAELQACGISDDHIIYLNFEDFDNIVYTEPEKLHQFLKSKITDCSRYYLFFDEIQEVANFERVINSWRSTHGCSIFITGSNSKLLSGELATYLTGRTVSIQMYPFCFREFVCWRHSGADTDELFDEYLRWGGFPQVWAQEDEQLRKAYLNDLYHMILIRDIIIREKIKNVDMLNRIAWFLFANLGSLVSANSIAHFLKNERLSISVDTVLNYIEYLDAAMVFSRARRFNLKGKAVMRTQDKQFLADLGLLRLKNTAEKNDSGKLENLVYNELLLRHDRVYVGKTEDGEIDFIGDDLSEGTTYYQVALTALDDDVFEREIAPFRQIDDNLPKVLLTLDRQDLSTDGYRHFNVVNWLLQ